MNYDRRHSLGFSGSSRSSLGSFIAKIGSIIVGGALLVGTLVVSIAFFAVALAVAAVVFGFFWWKTREIRRQLREQLQGHTQARRPYEPTGQEDVIEGVVISRVERTAEPRRTSESAPSQSSDERDPHSRG